MSVCDECITHSRTSIWAAGSPQGLEDTRRRFPLGAWSSVNTVHPCRPAVTPVTSEPLAKIHLPMLRMLHMRPSGVQSPHVRPSLPISNGYFHHTHLKCATCWQEGEDAETSDTGDCDIVPIPSKYRSDTTTDTLNVMILV